MATLLSRRGIVVVLLFAAVGCRPPQAPEQVERWGKAWIESLNSHQIQQVLPLLAPAATYQDPMMAKPLAGTELAISIQMRWNATPESHYDMRSVNGTPTFVAVEWTATNFGAVTATGPVDGVFLIHLSGNLITSVRGYYDTGAAASGAH